MPQYTYEALNTMNTWLGEYYRAVDEKKLNATEEKKAFFNDKNPQRMVEPDPAIFGEILHFLEH